MLRFWDGIERWDGSHFDRFSQLADSPFKWGIAIVAGLMLTAILIVGILLLVKMSRRTHENHASAVPVQRNLTPGPGAQISQSLGILNDRLARGEIDVEEYDKIKAKLEE